jgi:ubiquinone/menaquinone biosynthesis C-methylase UbiE
MKKEWWNDFFEDLVGEIMFAPRATQSKQEVQEILKQTKIKKPARILDLACGVGRHTHEFAMLGFDTIGLDYSNNYLAQARRKKSKAQFLHGDMKQISKSLAPDQFDLVVSLYNSFGYFDKRSDDVKMLKEVYKVLKPGGKFVINTLNKQGVAEKLTKPFSKGLEPIKDVYMIDAAHFDEKKSQTNSFWTIIDTRKSKTKIFKRAFKQNVYSHDELCKLLRKAGFKIEKTWGLLKGGPFAKNSWHQTIVAKK